MAPDASPALKLRAEDADDLAVLSACLQDALVAVRDLGYLADERSFIFVANRFRWETGLRPLPGEEGHQRVLCAVTLARSTALHIAVFAAPMRIGFCVYWQSARRAPPMAARRSCLNLPAALRSAS